MRTASSEKGKKAGGEGEKAKRRVIFHPILFAVFPILALYAHNAGQVPASVVWRPLAVTVALALILLGLLGIALRNWRKAGLLSSLVVFLFFSYGHFRAALGEWGWGVLGVNIGPAKVVVLTMGIALVLGVYFIVKTRKDLRKLTNVLNVAGSCLVIISVLSIVGYKVRTSGASVGEESEETFAAEPMSAEDRAGLPHIYYIILDAYARADVLKDIYGHDNSDFVKFLKSKGFYVARKSRSNYCQSDLSMASSLNLKYLDDLVERIGAEYDTREPLRRLMGRNRAMRFLKQQGYTTVAFASGYSGTELKAADVYRTSAWFLNEFEHGVIDMTPIPAVLSKLSGLRMGTLYRYGMHRKRILFTFDHLAEPCLRQEPVFVFSHIIAPHPPFLFGPEGEAVTPTGGFWEADRDDFREAERQAYVKGYRDQLIYINSRVRSLVEEVLAKSSRPAIIILQADHGPRCYFHWSDPEKVNFKEALGILNAVRVPDEGRVGLYEEMTPVNTFRLIFNAYLGTNLKRLKDESYYSTYTRPYKFLNVTEKVE